MSDLINREIRLFDFITADSALMESFPEKNILMRGPFQLPMPII